MVDLDVLKARGITVDSLRQRLAGNPLEWNKVGGSGVNDPYYDGKTALWHRIRSRIQEGMNRNFQDYKIYHALDLAWETPFRQVSPTLLGYFIEHNNIDDKEALEKAVGEWGLTHMLEQELDPRSGKPTGKHTFNLPIFFNIFVPLVRAYVTIRWAKIMNDRRLIPFFKYEPAKFTAVSRLKCDAITDRVQQISNQYGFYDVVKQAVLKMLHYSVCYQFPKESWHSEEQIRKADSTDVAIGRKNTDGQPCKLGDNIKVTSREGLRYHLPHPTRIYRDLNHGAWTYNYDCGCEFAGYWMIQRYRDIYFGPYWNKEYLSIGPNSLIQDHRTFFASVYSACTLNIPTIPPPSNDGNTLLAQTGAGIGEMDREKALSYLYYGTNHLDQGVLSVEHFEKCIPSRDGLGDYDYPVWFRFKIAGDISTFIYAEPLPYNPIIYYGYDADESRTNNSSLSLEVLPFQDQFSNLLTQIILTAKQNLANATFVDEDLLPEDSKNRILNLKEKIFRAINFIPYSGRRNFRTQQRVQEAFSSISLPKGNVAELTNVLKTILDVLERVLVMSSHEVAQPASHEQTREEVRNIAQSTTSRLMFTSTPVDIARDAMKRQIYEGLMAFGDEDIYAHISSDVPLSADVLTKMGFTFVDPDTHHREGDRHRRIKVKKGATALELWELASTKDGDDRANDAQTAQAMGQLVQQLMANPMTAQAIGAQQAIDLANQIAQLAGLDRDFKLRDMTPQQSPEQQQAAAQQQLQQVVQQVLQQVQQQIQPLVQASQENQNNIAVLQAAMARSAGVVPSQMNGTPQPPNLNGTPRIPPTPGPGIPGPQGLAQPAGV